MSTNKRIIFVCSVVNKGSFFSFFFARFNYARKNETETRRPIRVDGIKDDAIESAPSGARRPNEGQRRAKSNRCIALIASGQGPGRWAGRRETR